MNYNGSFLKSLRLQQNKTQQEVASGICAVSYLSKIENNTTACSAEIWNALLAKLQFIVDDTTEHYNISYLLDEWYTSFLKYEEDDRFKTLFTQLQTLTIQMNDEQLFLFHLFSIRYSLLCDDYEAASRYNQLLSGLQLANVRPEIIYWHNKIIALYEYNVTENLTAARTAIHNAMKHTFLSSLTEDDIHETKLFYCSFFSRYDESEPFATYLQQSITYYTLHSNYTKLVKCFMLQGIHLTTKEDYVSADLAYERAIHYCHEAGQFHEYGGIIHNRAVVHFLQQKIDTGFTLLQEAFRVKDVGHSKLQSGLLLLQRYMTYNQSEAATTLWPELLAIWESDTTIRTPLLKQQMPFFYHILHVSDYNIVIKQALSLCDYLQQNGHFELFHRYAMFAADFFNERHQYKIAAHLYRLVALPTLQTNRILY